MFKKVIIIILITLIILSLGTVGYLFYSQKNPDWLTAKTDTGSTPVAPTNPFPIASNTPNLSNNSPFPTNPAPPAQPISPSNPALPSSVTGLTTIKDGATARILFIDKETGNIYTLNQQNNAQRLTNTTIPGIGEALWGGGSKTGWRVILRQLKNNQIVNLVGRFTFASSSEPVALETAILPISLTDLAVSPDGQQIFFLVKNKDGSASGFISNFDLKNPKLTWTSPLADWLVEWPTKNMILLTSKPTHDYPGMLWSLNPITKETKKILDETNGLTVKISPDGSRIVYSRSLLNGFSFYQYDIETKTSRLLEFNTLPEKCVWQNSDALVCAVPRRLPTGNYPDDWYQGKISFIDDVWKIDLKQRTTTLIQQAKGNFDLLTPAINGTWFYAINKNDNTLQIFGL